MTRQLVVIHGGDTYSTYEEYLEALKHEEFDLERYSTGSRRWKDRLPHNLGDAYQVIAPQMPNKDNCRYLEWEIYFDKVLPHLYDGVILLGHSIGGIFLAKYLSENSFPKRIAATILVAPPFDEADAKYSLGDFVLPISLKKFEEQGGAIHLFFSKDDPLVPFVDAGKYQKALPSATSHLFDSYEHFNIEEFPEIIDLIKNIQ